MSYTGTHNELKGMPIAIYASYIFLNFYNTAKYATAIDYTNFSSTASPRHILILNFATPAAGCAASSTI
ncbi:hypothetical protein NW757_011958 [Fusarium falciforme]|nr:hypothetical protein NW757_011958 [Fusarium falciforme]